MNSTVDTEKRYTAEELLRLPHRENYELVDGRLVERHASALCALVTGELICRLLDFGKTRELGWLLAADCGFCCFPGKPNHVRFCSVTFVRSDRWPFERAHEEYVRVAPDLAVELVAPSDTAADIEQKVQDFLDAGTGLIWVIYPTLRTVRIHRADGTTERLQENDELGGESILPDFKCRVAELFATIPALLGSTR